MGEVKLSIHGKSYDIACDDGQEPRVAALGRYVDQRLKEIAAAGAAVSDSHLLVLTAIVLADEIHELRVALQETSEAHNRAQREVSGQEREIVDAINHMVLRINSVTERLQKAS